MNPHVGTETRKLEQSLPWIPKLEAWSCLQASSDKVIVALQTYFMFLDKRCHTVTSHVGQEWVCLQDTNYWLKIPINEKCIYTKHKLPLSLSIFHLGSHFTWLVLAEAPQAIQLPAVVFTTCYIRVWSGRLTNHKPASSSLRASVVVNPWPGIARTNCTQNVQTITFPNMQYFIRKPMCCF